MNQYETVFILNPVLSDEQIRETVDKFVGYLENRGAKIINRENWGLRKLAYPIEKKKSGFYQFIEFQSPTEVIENYEVEIKRDERIMRFLTVRMDKYGIEYADKRRNKVKAAK
ncbi:MAG: 30S ribosomal protein S6 [Bacteroidota bacterium]|nr:30S ribosomal protein S6 [Bacteroidota bacterium]MDX5404797.1 30S ribosomal protein S6 [Bacteroidota bacterium]MDX5428022.1 30S ribosomal protein S6 [Bacteroidota bacterium]MDX5447437.1 30S ribosomal protein S6 [Bacteroidota bacterium]MDX5505863.1 30S ribosomal protein S6 [Bacteroidota bacterium]